MNKILKLQVTKCEIKYLFRKPATKRHARYLKGREPKLIENDKTCLVIRGGNASQQIVNVLKELVCFVKAFTCL